MPSVSLYVGARLTDLADVLTSQVVSKKYNQDTGVPYEHVDKKASVTLKKLGGEYPTGYDAAVVAARAVREVAKLIAVEFEAIAHRFPDHLGDNGNHNLRIANDYMVCCPVRQDRGNDDYCDAKVYDPDALDALVGRATEAFKLTFGFDVPVFVAVDRGENYND